MSLGSLSLASCQFLDQNFLKEVCAPFPAKVCKSCKNRLDNRCLYDVLFKKSSAEEKETFQKRKFRVLHAAIWKGQQEVVSALIPSKDLINAQDAYGWAPVHYAAAMCKTDILRTLLTSGANLDTETNKGGTYKDFEELVNHTSFSGPDAARSKTTAMSDLLFKEWGPRKEISRGYEALNNELIKAYKKHKTEPCPLEEGLASAVATRDIPIGCVIKESGCFHLIEMSEGLELSIDRLDRLIMMYEAFPNVRRQQVYNCAGLSRRFVWVSIRPIKKGEQLYVDCGLREEDIKTTLPYPEIDPSGVRAFLADQNLDLMWKQFSTKTWLFGDHWKAFRFLYVCDTPFVLMPLLLEGALPLDSNLKGYLDDQWTRFNKLNGIKEYIYSESFSHLMTICQNFREALRSYQLPKTNEAYSSKIRYIVQNYELKEARALILEFDQRVNRDIIQRLSSSTSTHLKGKGTPPSPLEGEEEFDQEKTREEEGVSLSVAEIDKVFADTMRRILLEVIGGQKRS